MFGWIRRGYNAVIDAGKHIGYESLQAKRTATAATATALGHVALGGRGGAQRIAMRNLAKHKRAAATTEAKNLRAGTAELEAYGNAVFAGLDVKTQQLVRGGSTGVAQLERIPSFGHAATVAEHAVQAEQRAAAAGKLATELSGVGKATLDATKLATGLAATTVVSTVVGTGATREASNWFQASMNGLGTLVDGVKTYAASLHFRGGGPGPAAADKKPDSDAAVSTHKARPGNEFSQ